MEQGQHRVHFDWTINFGHLLTMLMIVAAVLFAWADMEKRVAALEAQRVINEQRAAKYIPILEKLDATLDRLDRQLADFPHHKHLDNRIVYPAPLSLRPQSAPDR